MHCEVHFSSSCRDPSFLLRLTLNSSLDQQLCEQGVVQQASGPETAHQPHIPHLTRKSDDMGDSNVRRRKEVKGREILYSQD
jgi:hypothetical protein